MMDSHSDILKRFGNKPLADALGTSQNHIRTMQARNSIPLRYWQSLIEFAREQGDSLSDECLRKAAVKTTPVITTTPQQSTAQ